MRRSKEFFARTLALALAASMPLTMGTGIQLVSAANETNVQTQAKGNFPYADGTYNGSAKGFIGDIEVAVTIKDQTITKVDILSTVDTPSYFEMAKPLADQVVEKQSTEIDTVSGATFSSKGILNAVDKALKTAEEITKKQEETGQGETTEKQEDEKQEETSKYVYGTVNLNYADYYYGELNSVKENATMDLEAADKVGSLRTDKGQLDAVTSATASKSTRYSTTDFTKNKDGSVTINGIKDVHIAVPTALYEEAIKAVKEGKTCKNQLLNIIKDLKVEKDTPKEYKVLNGDGTLTEMKDSVEAKVNENASKTVSVQTTTPWGNYQINVVDSDNLPSTATMEGVVLEMTDGSKYAMKHSENLWLQTGEMALVVKEGFVEPHGNQLPHQRFADIEGKTLKKVTYIVRDGADLVYDNINIYMKKILDTNAYGYTANTGIFADGVQTKFTAKLPSDSNYQLKSVSYGSGRMASLLEAGTDYIYDAKTNVLTINKTENTKVGTYSLVFEDETYGDLSAKVLLKSDMKADAVKIENNKVVISDSKVTLAEYLDGISSVKIDGKASGASASSIVDKDGNIKFDAVVVGRDKSKTPVFANYSKDSVYTLEFVSEGYPSIKATVGNPDGYKYVYAGLTWDEYWKSEGVYAAGNASSSSERDSRDEADKGGFDVVTRATKNHGLHRGSFQSIATIYDTDGNSYKVLSWSKDGKTINLVDGSSIGWSKGTITKSDGTTSTMKYYEVSGIKYVPVKVKEADYEEFAKKYQVTENAGSLTGGYSENQLKAYVKTAKVTKDTNGLKTATKNADGSFSFSARETGTDSGLVSETLKKVEKVTATVKEASGSFGEFLRVDLTGDGYGDLGSAMYAVKWSYYGSDSKNTKPLTTYGTKFAADNWMHKLMGIQLGLTESERCKLPKGTDGTGYWALTVYAMGYEDYTVNFKVTDANIVKPKKDEVVDVTALKTSIQKAEALKESNYTKSTWASMQMELAEAKEALGAKSQAVVDEAIAHLDAAVKELVEKKTPTITVKDKTVTYNGKAQTIGKYQTYSDSKCTKKVNAKDAGTYYVKVVVKATDTTKEASKVVKLVIKKANQTINEKDKTVTFNNKVQKIRNYQTYSDSKCTKKVNAKNVGTYYVKITKAGNKNYNAATKVVKLVIKQANPTIKTKVSSKTYKVSAVNKKAQSFTIGASVNSKGKLTYKSSNSKFVKVTSLGKVTVVKKAKKGTYTITVSAKAKGNYKAGTKTVKIVVK
ncbi:hypothetical protein P261_02014 [Lachnospiraceae bacterium TWA4]|nr:hypothetical protein P261_02014 [Lachnospiraceae bacterium TWA4]